MLRLQGAQVHSLVGELRYCMPWGVVKSNNNNIDNKKNLPFPKCMLGLMLNICMNHLIYSLQQVYVCYAQFLLLCLNLMWPYGPEPARLLSPWDSPCKNTGVGFLLSGVFLTQVLNLCLLHFLHCRRILYSWATGEATELSGIAPFYRWGDWDTEDYDFPRPETWCLVLKSNHLRPHIQKQSWQSNPAVTTPADPGPDPSLP